MPTAIDYAFPAVDAATVTTLGSSGGTIDATSITNTINAAERTNFLTTLNSSDGASNNALTYGMLLNRNVSLSDSAKDMIAENKRAALGGPKETYARQGEINEWQAQNKLDTLFFLQLTFLFFTVLVFLLFLRQYGVITSSILWIFVVILGLLVVGTLVSRVSYTSNSRDQRHWNRRFLGLADSGLSAKIACATD
jgi:uncharacterized membrane protein